MNRHSNLIRFSRTLGLLAAAILVFIAPASLNAADTTHHFDIKAPEQIVMNEPATFSVTARTENGELNAGARMKIVVHMTTGRGTRTVESNLRQGAAEVDLVFNEAGVVIVQVTNKANAELTNSQIVRVLPAVAKTEVKP